MPITHNFVTVCYTFVCTVIISDCFQAVDPHHYCNRQWMHLVRLPRSSEISAALLSVRVGSACNVYSHSLGSVQLGPLRFRSARLGLQCEWALTFSVQLTAGKLRHTTERCFDVRWLRLHSVLTASPVITAQFQVLATLTLSSRFPLH